MSAKIDVVAGPLPASTDPHTTPFKLFLMDCQDWTPVKIHNAAGKPNVAGASSAPAATAHTQPAKFTSEAGAERKIAEADTPLKIKTFTPASRQEIVARRAAMKKTQVELNQLCSFPPNTIREIEAGRLAPTIGQLNTLNRVLKTGLKLG